MDFSKFDKAFDVEGLKRDVEELEKSDKGGEFKEVPLGSYTVKIEKMETELPTAARAFKMIHDARNQRTSAHYKDKNLKVRKEINGVELKTLLAKAKLIDAYIEIFDYINKK